MKYYDINSKSFISLSDLISDEINHRYRGDPRKYSCFGVDDDFEFFDENYSNEEESNVLQLSIFDL